MRSAKNLVLTITHGRTGTTFLTELCKLFDDTRAEHEPEPNYASIMPKAKFDPRYAVLFVREKLKVLSAYPEANYVETSNVFGKAFFVPMVRLGVYPRLIFLNRDFRDTATSLYVRGSIPMRTDRGRHYSTDPTAPGVLQLYQPATLSDYQLCYWAVLDCYRRQLQAATMYDRLGWGDYLWTTPQGLNDFDHFIALGDRLGLTVSDMERARADHSEIAQTHHNQNRAERKADNTDYAEEEVEVLDRIGYYDPLFVRSALEAPFVRSEIRQRFAA